MKWNRHQRQRLVICSLARAWNGQLPQDGRKDRGLLIRHASVTCHLSPRCSQTFAPVFSLAFCLFSSHSTVFPVLSHFAPSDRDLLCSYFQIREPMRGPRDPPTSAISAYLAYSIVKTALFFVTRVDASPCTEGVKVPGSRHWLKRTRVTAGNCSRGPKGPTPFTCSSPPSHPGSASAHPAPALISRAQGGTTFDPERGRLQLGKPDQNLRRCQEIF